MISVGSESNVLIDHRICISCCTGIIISSVIIIGPIVTELSVGKSRGPCLR